jgi:cytochrome c biogenesis protein CcmG/thiol:disulfide interchange protein DsbE
MRRVWYPAAVLTVLGLAGCTGAAERRFAAQVKNKPAPDFELTALDGAKVRLSDQRGKPVLLAFFAYS